MPHNNIIAGNTEDEIWQTIGDQLNNKNDNLDYTAQFTVLNHAVNLDIDIHPDRGEDNEKPVTSFTSELASEISFRFKIEKQGLKHEIGKLFGMQDVIIGHTEFDKKFLIQSNDAPKVKEVLSNAEVSDELLQHPVVAFEIRERKIGVNKRLEFRLDLNGTITEAARLKDAFQPFKIVLKSIL